MILKSKVKGPALTCPEYHRGRKRLQANSASRGFTLIELLIVISIIGILAGMIIVNLSVARAKARDAKRKADLASIQTAVEMYADRNGSYPVQTPAWGNSDAGGGTPNPSWVPSIVPNYITVLPIDPRNDGNYHYLYGGSSSGADYKIMAWKLETDEGKEWAANDGGRYNCVTASECAYELFSSGAGSWGAIP